MGLEEIDADHRKLVDMVNDIYKLIEEHEREKCSKAIDQFIGMMSMHFDKEEGILARIGFPGIEEHLKYHGSLVIQAKTLKRICDAELEIGKIENCYDETVSLLIDDIVKGDSEFKSYVQYKGYAKK